uniref:Uncharacterized protein n=1 Tax=Rhizophora mucronata TaxID=61149 RepID=A0A2P2NNG0_RHIMU
MITHVTNSLFEAQKNKKCIQNHFPTDSPMSVTTKLRIP